MVNTRIISRHTGPLPERSSTNKKISGGPLYPAHEVLELLEKNGSQIIKTWTKKCVYDVQELAFDPDDLLNLVKLAIRRGRFIGSEWCTQSPRGPWAASDAYSVTNKEWIQAAHKEMDMEYYIKFAIGMTGNILLLVSCHPSGNRR